MNKLILIGGAAVGFGLLFLVNEEGGEKEGGESLTPDEKVSGIPTAPRLSTRIIPPGPNTVTSNFRIGPSEYLLDGSPLTPNDPIERYNELGKIVNDIWALRATVLPPDADPLNTDKYSKELYWVPSWLANWKTYGDPRLKSKQELIAGGNGVPVDEFGRTKSGKYGQADNSIWGQTFGGLLKNPLFQTVVMGALIASGPQGMAVYGAYTMWKARGQDLTSTNTLLLAGRAYAVSQCGPACGVAFDFGVGVASGKSIDTAAEDALYQEMTDEQKAYYEQGKDVVHKMGM